MMLGAKLSRAVGAFLISLFIAMSAGYAAEHDMAQMTVLGNPGTGTLQLGVAVPPYLTFAAIASSGETVSYGIQDTAGNWERGRGVWTTGSFGGSLTRGVVASSNSNGLVNFGSGSTIVWMTALAEDMVTTTYPSKVLSSIAEPPCTPSNSSGTITLALAACPTVTNGVGYWQVTLTGNATLAITGPVAGAGFQLDVTEGSGPFALTVPTGLFFPPSSLCTGAGVPSASCTAVNQLVLSGVAQGKNTFYCRVASSTPTFTCGAVQAGLVQASSSTYVITAHSAGTTCANGTTCASNATTLTSGGTLFIGIGYCEASDCATTGTNGVTSVAGSGLSGCSLATGAKSSVTRAVWAEIWKCTTVPSGSTTVTATIAGAGGFYTVVMLAEVGIALTDDAHGNYATGTSGTSSVNTGSTSQNNEFIFAFDFLTSSNAIAAGAGYTLIDANTSAGSGDEWSGSNTAGVNAATATFTSTTWAAVVAAFHP